MLILRHILQKVRQPIFDSEFAYAIGSKGKLFEIAKGIWLTAEVGYLSFEPQDEENVSTPKHALNTPGDLSIEWSEIERKHWLV